ncbi:MAG TPA: ferrous iron transporter B, partial [Rectinema sp.]|nr:ferrous iron transporter B [Rectinema sp.]
MQDRVILTIALAGNPNSGKTSVFNAITGAHHKVGNYPGVTVEKREGKIEFRDCEIRVVDLPGTYSLTAYSLDEVVARDFLLNEKPDIVIDVLDSTNLERNLYLLLQLIELEIPVVAALNMADEAKEKGIVINHGLLSKTLGVPMVPTVGSRGEGVEELLNVAISTYEAHTKPRMPSYGEDIEVHIANLVALLKEDSAFSAAYSPRWIAIKLIEKDADAKKRISGHIREAEILAALEDTWRWIALHYRKDPEILISEQRYGYIHGAVAEAVRRTRQKGIPLTEQIDNVVMHPFISLPLFFLIIWAIFKLTFAIGEYPMAWLEGLFADLTRFIQNLPLPDGVMDFLVNAVIHGVGGVLSFVPLIVILFFCISFLEDTGYIARA